jgi:PHD/YefM family antitoxin component YafN of YafNO toxin-antitoxin module
MDRTLSVTSARQQLLKLTKSVRLRMDRVVLTNKGEAEAVLLSVGEYNSLKAAAELALRPDILHATEEGFAQFQEGLGRPLAQVLPVQAHADGLQPGAAGVRASARISSTKRRTKRGGSHRPTVEEKIEYKLPVVDSKSHGPAAELKAPGKSLKAG